MTPHLRLSSFQLVFLLLIELFKKKNNKKSHFIGVSYSPACSTRCGRSRRFIVSPSQKVCPTRTPSNTRHGCSPSTTRVQLRFSLRPLRSTTQLHDSERWDMWIPLRGLSIARRDLVRLPRRGAGLKSLRDAEWLDEEHEAE